MTPERLAEIESRDPVCMGCGREATTHVVAATVDHAVLWEEHWCAECYRD